MNIQEKKYDFKTGEVLLVNKPLNWTSFDVVNKLRYAIKNRLGIKKIKVGHAGTLDPLADGLLIICTGKKTKEIESFMGLEKGYSGTITLGSTTPSYDLETKINQTFSLDHLIDDNIKLVANKMIGEQNQMPPIFSAKKINGNKAYDLARKGEEVKLTPRQITVTRFDLPRIEIPEVDFFITCSKGTYIRSIAHDFGLALDNGGHLSALRRESIGDFKLESALSVDEWINLIETVEIDNNSTN